jgi:hypothetical protein
MGQKIASSPFRSNQGVAAVKAPLQLEGKLSLLPAIFGPLLSGSDLKGKGFKEREGAES